MDSMDYDELRDVLESIKQNGDRTNELLEYILDVLSKKK